MKAIMIGLLLVSGRFAFAGSFPGVGTMAEYVLTDNSGHYTSSLTLGTCTRHACDVRMGPIDEEWGLDQVYDENILLDCAANGGVIETITVKAGTFETCKTTVVNEYGTRETWLAPIAFLKVKEVATEPDSSRVRTTELTLLTTPSAGAQSPL